MTQDNLIARLTDGDHKRLCQGREYTCTCGYDDDLEAACKEAADLIERLSPPLPREQIRAEALTAIREPTDEMLNAGQERLCQIRSRTHFDDEAQAEIFKAMIDEALSSLPAPSDPVRQVAMELREALEPFAEVAKADIGENEAWSDLFKPMSRGNNRARLLTVGDFRRARSALASADAVMGEGE